MEFGAVHPSVRYSTVEKKAATPFLLKKKKNAKVVAIKVDNNANRKWSKPIWVPWDIISTLKVTKNVWVPKGK